MAWQDTAITVLVLLLIFIIVYCKMTNKTLPELVSEIREIFSPVEEVTRL